MATTPEGQISNHYKTDDWNLFDIQEEERADEYDGHTPQIALQRMLRLAAISTPPQHIPNSTEIKSMHIKDEIAARNRENECDAFKTALEEIAGYMIPSFPTNGDAMVKLEIALHMRQVARDVLAAQQEQP